MATKLKGKVPERNRIDIAITGREFAELVVYKGFSLSDAYKETHADSHLSGQSLYTKAHEFSKNPTVAAALDAVREELRAKNAAFGERLIGYLRADIDRAIRECNSLEPVMKQAALAADVLGLKKMTFDGNVAVGPIDSSSAKDKLTFLAQKAAKENAS